MAVPRLSKRAGPHGRTWGPRAPPLLSNCARFKLFVAPKLWAVNFHESPVTAHYCLRFIQLGDERGELLFEPGRGHLRGMEIDVEQRTLTPIARLDQPAGGQKAIVKRSPRERRLHGHLHVIESRLLDESRNEVEDLFGVAVEAEHETTVERNAVRLNPLDGGAIRIPLTVLPIGTQFKPIQSVGGGRLQTHQNLTAAALGDHPQQIVVLRDPNV